MHRILRSLFYFATLGELSFFSDTEAAAIRDRRLASLAKPIFTPCQGSVAQVTDSEVDSYKNAHATYQAWILVEFFDLPNNPKIVDGREIAVTAESEKDDFVSSLSGRSDGGSIEILKDKKVGQRSPNGGQHFIIHIRSNHKSAFLAALTHSKVRKHAKSERALFKPPVTNKPD